MNARKTGIRLMVFESGLLVPSSERKIFVTFSNQPSLTISPQWGQNDATASLFWPHRVQGTSLYISSVIVVIPRLPEPTTPCSVQENDPAAVHDLQFGVPDRFSPVQRPLRGQHGEYLRPRGCWRF